jgi:hypothetical protein
MELFPDGHHVRLQSRDRAGMYLHANEDGVGVCLSRERATLRAAWQVHRVHREDGATYVLLHGAAYGRYLKATDVRAPFGCRGVLVVQGVYDDKRDDSIAWVPVRFKDAKDQVLLQHKSGGTLRANGKYCRWLTGVSVDGFFKRDTMMLWVVEDIPPRVCTPELRAPGPVSPRAVSSPWQSLRSFHRSRGVEPMGICGIESALDDDVSLFASRIVKSDDLHSSDECNNSSILLMYFRSMVLLPQAPPRAFWDKLLCRTAPAEEKRKIRFLRAEGDGNVDPNVVWRQIEFHGRSVYNLRLEVARLTGDYILDFKLCGRAGNLGRLISLVADLPRNEEPLDVVLLPNRTRSKKLCCFLRGLCSTCHLLFR